MFQNIKDTMHFQVYKAYFSIRVFLKGFSMVALVARDFQSRDDM
jgi:hypothetical protein